MALEILPFIAQAEGQAPPDLVGMLIPFAAIIVIFYFLIIRPQKKKQQDHARLVGALKTGDEVVTVGGVHGRIANVKETTLMLKVADNVKIEIEKASVDRVLKTAEAANAS